MMYKKSSWCRRTALFSVAVFFMAALFVAPVLLIWRYEHSRNGRLERLLKSGATLLDSDGRVVNIDNDSRNSDLVDWVITNVSDVDSLRSLRKLQRIGFHDTDFSSNDCRQLEKMKWSIQRLEFDNVRINASVLDTVSRFKVLKELGFKNCKFDSDATISMRKLKTLEGISVSTCQMHGSQVDFSGYRNGALLYLSLEDVDLKQCLSNGFPDLSNLVYADFIANCAEDRDIACMLECMPKLRTLRLEGNPISGEVFRVLPRSITQVSVSHCKLRGETFFNLANCANLQAISFSYCKLTDEDVALLPPMHISSLALMNNPITDACMSSIFAFADLDSIALNDTYMSDAGVATIQSRFPNAHVTGSRSLNWERSMGAEVVSEELRGQPE